MANDKGNTEAPSWDEMVNTSIGGGTALAERPQTQLLSKAEALGMQLQQLIDTVPESGDDAELDIIRQVFRADSVDQLDQPWEADGLEQYDGHHLTAHSIKRMPSSFEGGLGWYLVVDTEDRVSGRRFAVTTGSVSVVAQLLKAWALQAYPLDFIPRKAQRPSARGYYPMHLEIVSGKGR